jgi:hypothetical protein
MKNAPIVPGVPTPYFFQNRVYPSRFHGGIWTRPVFGFPKIARPQDVFTPGYDIDRQVPQPTLSGLGSTGMGWQTGEGVFKPGGYGGGVFDGNISGLGSIGRRVAVRGIGDAAVSSYPWRVKSLDTISLQSIVNAELMAKSMCPIGVDGKLGGGTCGAIQFLTNNGVATTMPTECQGHTSEFKAPIKNTGKGCGGGSAPVTVSTSPIAPQAFQSGMSSSTKRVLGFALGGVLAIGAVVLLRKKK